VKIIYNLGVKRGDDGSKHLDIQMHGVIDGGFWEDDAVNTSNVISEMNQHRDAKTIGVRINSMGGSAFGGVAMYNALQDHPADVTCTVEGLAASAASLVAMAGKTVMGKGAMMMIHSPSTVAQGNSRDLRKMADVLDKVQDSLATIYTAKTGKSLDAVNDLLDDETWMTADEACAAGFADEVMPDVKTDYGPGEQVPAEQEDEDDDGDAEDRAPQLTADGVRWGGVLFPVNVLPQQILAMAKPPVQTSALVAPPVLAIVPPPAPAPAAAPLTRAELELRAPELIKAIAAEGHAAGVAAERTRLKEIDDLGVAGCTELVAAAKYGEKPSDAAALALAIVKAGQHAGADLLAVRRQESQPLVAIAPGAIDQTAAAEQARLVKAMVDGGNARRGGVR
jgi:ATP-dependent Clp endopeptidase proteolytic subunit ClpP